MDLNSNVISAFSISGAVTVSINLSPKMFLQEPYNDTTMNTSLNSSSYLPVNQPYSGAPWNYSGSESVATEFFSSHRNIVDWVLLELKSGTSAGSQALDLATVSYDFITDSSQAYGNNLIKKVLNGIYIPAM